MFLRRKKNTDTAPLLTEAAGQWLPAPLALLLTPGQASSLRVELALRPGERPVLALETLQADAGAVRLRGQGTLELATAADVLASPLALDCSLAVSSAADAAALLPQARALLALLGDALRLDIGVKGSPGAPEPRLELACATLDLGGHAVNDLSLLAGGEALPWPQLAAKGKVELPLSLQVRTGKDHISTKLRLRAGMTARPGCWACRSWSCTAPVPVWMGPCWPCCPMPRRRCLPFLLLRRKSRPRSLRRERPGRPRLLWIRPDSPQRPFRRPLFLPLLRMPPQPPSLRPRPSWAAILSLRGCWHSCSPIPGLGRACGPRCTAR